jgi:molybdopterin/thiamine biosynthesis adenylyltransferase
MSIEKVLTEEMLHRYDRNILIKGIGVTGQTALINSKILVIGAGGLGSPAVLYLAAAGVGTLGIADFDSVDITNLQRQIIHATADIGRRKTQSASEKIKALNPGVTVITHEERLDRSNIRGVIRSYDFVIDATDNFTSKFLINDSCILEDKPFSHGGVLGLVGQTMTVIPRKSACYRCVFTKEPDETIVDTSSKVGILGSVAGILGSIQATEAIKFVTKTGELLTDKLLAFDARNFEFRKIKVNRNGECRACGR